MSVLEGVERDLAAFPEDLSSSGTAELARAMARRIDEGHGSPSECGKVLLDSMATLRELAPIKVEEDALNDIRSRRRLRLAGGSDT